MRGIYPEDNPRRTGTKVLGGAIFQAWRIAGHL